MRVGIQLTEVAQVESVAVTADAVTIALVPNAVAATAQNVSGAASRPVEVEGPEHHIASDKFSTSANNGGPWTPRYQELFDKAGMSLDDAANKVRVPGHKGPHPQEYHEEIFVPGGTDERTPTTGTNHLHPGYTAQQAGDPEPMTRGADDGEALLRPIR